MDIGPLNVSLNWKWTIIIVVIAIVILILFWAFKNNTNGIRDAVSTPIKVASEVGDKKDIEKIVEKILKEKIRPKSGKKSRKSGSKNKDKVTPQTTTQPITQTTPKAESKAETEAEKLERQAKEWKLKIVKQNAKPSKGEAACKKAVEEIFGKEFHCVHMDWLRNPKTNRHLELDLYNHELKIAIEYHGEQHYKKVKRYHKNEDVYEMRKFCDEIKIQLCDQYGIYLIPVPHTVELSEIRDYIIYYLPHNRKKRLEQGITE